MLRPSYRRAIEWVALNDDPEWIDNHEQFQTGPSVAAALIADLFGKTDDQVRADLKRLVRRRGREGRGAER